MYLQSGQSKNGYQTCKEIFHGEAVRNAAELLVVQLGLQLLVTFHISLTGDPWIGNAAIQAARSDCSWENPTQLKPNCREPQGESCSAHVNMALPPRYCIDPRHYERSSWGDHRRCGVHRCAEGRQNACFLGLWTDWRDGPYGHPSALILFLCLQMPLSGKRVRNVVAVCLSRRVILLAVHGAVTGAHRMFSAAHRERPFQVFSFSCGSVVRVCRLFYVLHPFASYCVRLCWFVQVLESNPVIPRKHRTCPQMLIITGTTWRWRERERERNRYIYIYIHISI